MVYVVLSTDASGERKIDEAGSLDAALQHVERLRNEDGVSDVRVLREVPIEVKTYYKVVALEEGSSSATEAAASTPPAPPEPAHNGTAASELTVTAHEEDVAEATAAPASDAPPQADGAGADFFTPPPVRSHELDAGDEDAVPDAPSERRTSLFGRG